MTRWLLGRIFQPFLPFPGWAAEPMNVYFEVLAEQRIAYLLLRKCACSSIVGALEQLRRGDQARLSVGELHRDRPTRQLAEQIESLPSWYTFTLVRDPIRRFLSFYSDKILNQSLTGNLSIATPAHYGYRTNMSLDEAIEVATGGQFEPDLHVLPCAQVIDQAGVKLRHIGKVENFASSIEGASQRVQEDTLKFARIMEGLGAELLRSLMTLIAFTPILWGLSKSITVLPWIGEVEHALVWVAILSALGGTILLASVGIKLPGIEYDIQKEEAAYRKELVLGEDFAEKAKPEKITDLYGGVRKIHYKMYFHYLYFNAVKWSYLQGMVIVPYLALAPTIVTGAITLGFVQQIIRAFGRVETSLQYLVRSWPIIVELISVWKRLREFEAKLEKNISMETVK